MHAAIKAGLETIPAIVRDIEDDEAIVIMVDANIQREELLPSEKAFAYKMKLGAMKRQAGRPPKNNSCQSGTNLRSDEELGNQVGESARSIQRYIRLTELIPGLLDYVDKKRLQFTVAVDISYIDKEIQTWLFEYIKENGTVKAVHLCWASLFCLRFYSSFLNTSFAIISYAFATFPFRQWEKILTPSALVSAAFTDIGITVSKISIFSP